MPILGTKETILRINQDSFLKWHNFYNPKNLIISAVGKLNAEELTEIAKNIFLKEKIILYLTFLYPKQTTELLKKDKALIKLIFV